MKALIFDLDGTLWETLERTWISVNEIVKKYDYLKDISKETIDLGMGTTVEECAELYMPYLDKDLRIKHLLEMLEWNAKQLEIYGGNVYPNLEKTLQKLKDNYVLGIVSNCGEGYIESFLHTSHLEKYFNDFIAAGAVKLKKSEAIRKLMSDNNIEEAIYIGDTIRDYQASYEANIPFIHAKYGFEPEFEYPHYINSFEQLPDFLEKIEQIKNNL